MRTRDFHEQCEITKEWIQNTDADTVCLVVTQLKFRAVGMYMDAFPATLAFLHDIDVKDVLDG